ncbi:MULTISPECIES: DUF6286 domain-containing protein [Streptomyces]|uniref:DUF6286 domain-containing protein n=1 Tax=Streptomyces fradiae ATCC 10745 = DSM 40063 TaxID=1319510 RepID=A0A1Y2P2T0_STRFR|nr:MULTISPECIES: DUF6286 domain-containing protein [Streptomyces]KAF0646762.1 hypothetical protein K701_26990 [Streptomyces fradiae ATCC 10745 = DSM 40063]OSY53529.1 hypothetical protein BG846_00803 [Streptomyces fradiae ATCC 10745 = DSM 40063]WOI58537.1 DUF6286 domain-containing protein [Streptomyces fradiae]
MTPDTGSPGRGSASSAHGDTAAPASRATGPSAKEAGPPGHGPSAPDRAAAGTGDERGGGHRTHRKWSARRVTSAVVAAVILVAAVAALVDVIAVRAGRPAAAWRRHLADELATRPVDDVWMLTGAAVAAALGVWLIILALTPGQRRWLPMRSPADCPRLRAFLDRDGAADLLRNAAMRVPGVSAAHVRVRRHRIRARADVRFRDARQVRDDLTAVLDEERDRLALARPPRVVVRVRRRPD